ncbi:hypothetical protein O181_006139 [Austropuccinia psidii MF-1]|uniref:BRCT domain-containing protein n=1 Tax=Austropuccinia psidii MF-1 TaxID=1389203 RepID=A0A9Q3BIT0_9BASI|nr:hypothetical protein [Austropuccinia psidii MF-1]
MSSPPKSKLVSFHLKNLAGKKTVSWGSSSTDSPNLQRNRILVQDTPPQPVDPVLANDEENSSQESYLADLLATSQDLSTQSHQALPQTSTSIPAQASLTHHQPVDLFSLPHDISLQLPVGHSPELGIETQKAHSSLEMNAKFRARYLTSASPTQPESQSPDSLSLSLPKAIRQNLIQSSPTNLKSLPLNSTSPSQSQLQNSPPHQSNLITLKDPHSPEISVSPSTLDKSKLMDLTSCPNLGFHPSNHSSLLTTHNQPVDEPSDSFIIDSQVPSSDRMPLQSTYPNDDHTPLPDPNVTLVLATKGFDNSMSLQPTSPNTPSVPETSDVKHIFSPLTGDPSCREYLQPSSANSLKLSQHQLITNKDLSIQSSSRSPLSLTDIAQIQSPDHSFANFEPSCQTELNPASAGIRTSPHFLNDSFVQYRSQSAFPSLPPGNSSTQAQSPDIPPTQVNQPELLTCIDTRLSNPSRQESSKVAAPDSAESQGTFNSGRTELVRSSSFPGQLTHLAQTLNASSKGHQPIPVTATLQIQDVPPTSLATTSMVPQAHPESVDFLEADNDMPPPAAVNTTVSSSLPSLPRPSTSKKSVKIQNTRGHRRVSVVIHPLQKKQKVLNRQKPHHFLKTVTLNASRSTIVKTLPDTLLPIKRVMAYRHDWEAFGPAHISSVTTDQVIVKFDDGLVLPSILTHLRLCEIRRGDLVKYIGTELAEDESQITDIRDPKRVLEVEMVTDDREDRALISKDVVICCRESEYRNCLQNSTPIENVSIKCRFLVEAVMVLPQSSRKYSGLNDRSLPTITIAAIQELMKAQSGVGMRTRLAPPLLGSTSSVAKPDDVFRGFGILLTASGTGPNEATVTSRKKASSYKEMIEQKIRERHGTVIDKVSDLYQFFAVNSSIEKESPSKGKRRARSDDHVDSYKLTLSPLHENLRAILLVADLPIKTFKYLMALSLGIPCVSIKWVIHSYEAGHALDWENYMIGPGPSAFLGGAQPLSNLQTQIINRPSHDLLSIFETQKNLRIFLDKTFMCISPKSKTKAEWSETLFPIICAAGASKISFALLGDVSGNLEMLQSFDYVLLDENSNSDFFHQTSNMGKKRKLTRTMSFEQRNQQMAVQCVVDFEWVKQCLIYGRILKPQLYSR